MRNPLASRRSTAALTLVALAAALTITACGEDDETESSSAEPKKLALEVTEQGKNKFSLTAPKTVEAGLVEMSLKTPAGRGTVHDAQLVRVEGDHTVAEVLKFIGSEGAPTPPWLFAAGGVGQTKGGSTGTATQELKPGRYIILDTGEPQGENVKSYAETGATAELEVTGKAQTAELPKTDAKITASEYKFSASGLKAGTNEIEFDNAGRELHHVIAFPYTKGSTLAKIKKAFKEEEEGPPSGPPPVDFENGVGTAVLEGGDKQVAPLELKAGKYALVCFISDRKGGPPHVAKGMISEATVE